MGVSSVCLRRREIFCSQLYLKAPRLPQTSRCVSYTIKTPRPPRRILPLADCDVKRPADCSGRHAGIITGSEVDHLRQLSVCMWQVFEQKHAQLPFEPSKKTVFPADCSRMKPRFVHCMKQGLQNITMKWRFLTLFGATSFSAFKTGETCFDFVPLAGVFSSA